MTIVAGVAPPSITRDEPADELLHRPRCIAGQVYARHLRAVVEAVAAGTTAPVDAVRELTGLAGLLAHLRGAEPIVSHRATVHGR